LIIVRCNTDSWKADFELQFHIHVHGDLLCDMLRLAFGKRRKSDGQTAADKQIQFGTTLYRCVRNLLSCHFLHVKKAEIYKSVIHLFFFSHAEHRVMRGIF